MKPRDVPAGPLVVDTDVLSFIQDRRERHAEFEVLLSGHVLAISCATLGELLAGAHNAGHGERRLGALRSSLSSFIVLPYDRVVVEAWAPLYAKLSGHLHAGGVNDLWTAACALTQTPPLPVVTNNLGDFGTIVDREPALRLVRPDL